MHRRKVQAAGKHFHQLFAVISVASTGAAQREGGANNDRKADLAGELNAVFQIIDERRFRHIEADALHGVFKKQAGFGLLNRADLRADQMHVILFEHATIGKFNGEIEGGLSPNRWQHSKTHARRHFALDANDLGEIFAGQRLNVGAIGRLGIGHDGGRVRVGQHNLKALRLERLASLRAGVVELGRLTDDDRPGAEDKDLRDISSTGHYRVFLKRSLVPFSWRTGCIGLPHANEYREKNNRSIARTRHDYNSEFFAENSGWARGSALPRAFLGHHLGVGRERDQWKILAIQVVHQIKHAGEARTGVERFVPGAVFVLYTQQISHAACHTFAARVAHGQQSHNRPSGL